MNKFLLLTATVFVLITVWANFLNNKGFPRIPGDILIEKPGIRIYIPIVSTLVISIILTFLLSSVLK